MKKKILLASLALLMMAHSSLAKANSWPGKLGKICFDTPQPKRFSEVDYKVAYQVDHSQTEEQRKKNIDGLKNSELVFDGNLTVQVNNGTSHALPKDKGLLIDNLDPKAKHTIKIKGTKGKTYQYFKIAFDNPDDPRMRISQGSFYHIQMMTMPPPKKCPWSLVE